MSRASSGSGIVSVFAGRGELDVPVLWSVWLDNADDGDISVGIGSACSVDAIVVDDDLSP